MASSRGKESGKESLRRRNTSNNGESTTNTAQGTTNPIGKGSEGMRKLLLGIGFWVQGLRCLPWLGVNFFLKDGLNMNPSSLQIIQNSALLPMVAKPFYGIVSDSCYILKEHRVPYIAIGAFLQAISWLVIAYLPPMSVSFFTLAFFLLLSNFGAAIVEVAHDAIVAESGRPEASSGDSNSSSSGNLQSFVWMASSIGGVIGNLVGGLAMESFSPQNIFFAFGIAVSIQFLVTMFIRERFLGLPKKNPSQGGIRKQSAELMSALRKPEISCSIAWFAASYALIPALTGTMFFFQTEHLKIEPTLLGISKVVGQVAMLLWGVTYDRFFKSMQSRKVISGIQIAMALFMISDILFVSGTYQSLGVPNSLYVVVFSGFIEVLCFCKILPFSILMAQLCPPGCEASVMAFLMSSVALALIVSAYLGVALTSYVGVTGNDFSGLSKGLLVQAACTLLPLFWSSFIPEDSKSKTKGKEN